MDIIFSPFSLFEGDDDDEANKKESNGEGTEDADFYAVRNHTFPNGKEICIREFCFHQLNANFLWPGTFAFSEWFLKDNFFLKGSCHRILELGSGTGALAIFLRKTFGVDITTSDFDDVEIEENIAHNCRANELEVLPHIRHTWGEKFPNENPDWDVIIASDILLYVKEYPNLIKTLCFLLKAFKRVENNRDKMETIKLSGKDVQLQFPIFLMSWRRRIGKQDEALFFGGCEDAGLVVKHLGSRDCFKSCDKFVGETSIGMSLAWRWTFFVGAFVWPILATFLMLLLGLIGNDFIASCGMISARKLDEWKKPPDNNGPSITQLNFAYICF